jgi:hypothetical protein
LITTTISSTSIFFLLSNRAAPRLGPVSHTYGDRLSAKPPTRQSRLGWL